MLNSTYREDAADNKCTWNFAGKSLIIAQFEGRDGNRENNVKAGFHDSLADRSRIFHCVIML
jgi:hypothetical protein